MTQTFHGSSGSRRQRLDLAPVSIRGLLIRLIVSAVATIVVVSLVTARVSRDVAVDIAISDATDRTVARLRGSIAPLLVDALIAGDQGAVARLDAVVHSEVVDHSVVSLKVWSEDGTVVYSNEPRLIGERFELDVRLSLFDGAEPAAGVSDLTAHENRYEQADKLLEVYMLSETREGTPLLVEAYHDYAGVTAVGDHISRRLTPIAVATVIVVEMIQIPFAVRLARRLRSGQRRNEQLVGHALATSDAERRRIAEGLHLGPLQDLVGSSMNLAAASRAIEPADPRLDASSTGIRNSVDSMRSLLIDIAPRDGHVDDIETYLAQLLNIVDEHGISTELAVTGGSARLLPATTDLVCRVAHELVRDSIHDRTVSAVRVELQIQSRSVEIVVVDNRRPHPTAPIVRRHRSVGMSNSSVAGLAELSVIGALSDLVADAGGQLTTGDGGSTGRWARLELQVLEGSGARRRSR